MRLCSAHGTPHSGTACAYFVRPPRTRELEHSQAFFLSLVAGSRNLALFAEGEVTSGIQAVGLALVTVDFVAS